METYVQELMRAAGPLKDNLRAMIAQWERKVPDPVEHLLNTPSMAEDAFRSPTKDIDSMLLERYLVEEDTDKLLFVVSRNGYLLRDVHGLFRSSIEMAQALATLDHGAYARAYLQQTALLITLRRQKCAAVPSGTFMLFYLVRSFALQAERLCNLDDLRNDLDRVAFYVHLALHLTTLEGFYREMLIYTNSVAHQILYQVLLENNDVPLDNDDILPHCAIAYATMFLSPCPSLRIFRGRAQELLAFWEDAPAQLFRHLKDDRSPHHFFCRQFRVKFVRPEPLSVQEATAAEQLESLYIAAYDVALHSSRFYTKQNPSTAFVELLLAQK